MSLQIKNLSKSYDGITLFRDFSIEFPEGTITCILGPSGCGKTTLLNIISKTIKPNRGTFLGFDEKVVSYIFQEPRLLPWKTVAQNIDFVLNKEIPPEERKKIIAHFINLVELDGFANFYPAQLSGGMKQRVSIARAFAYPSDIILMDEPLKGLDIKLKLNMIRAFSRIWQTDRRTVVFVTHDVEEALLLGNEIITFSQAPVSIKSALKITTPLAQRELNTEYFIKLKHEMLSNLGE